MKVIFGDTKTIIQEGETLATVISEPGLQIIKRNGRDFPIVHFEARDKSNNLIECVAFNNRALRAKDMNVGDQVVVSIEVTISAIDSKLEYQRTGHFICVDQR